MSSAKQKKKASKPGKKAISKRIARIRSAFARTGKGSSSVTVVRAGSKKQKAAARKVTYISVIPFKDFSEKPFKEKPFKDFSEKPFSNWSDFWNYIEWKDRAK